MKPLHHKKHPLAKRGLSLLCVLALCLGLLPATALAAEEDAPGTLYVGQTQITGSGYWKTNSDGTLTTKGANNDNYNVHYDGNGTLTLKDATIQGGNDSQNPQPEDYGIYAAPTGNQSVSLTINLIGNNTVGGHCGICVEAKTGDYATLVIQSNGNDPKGSLVASGSSWNGISVSATQGNASLMINNASVEASSGAQNYHGVSLISYTASNPELSLTVNGGSLTAQGHYGIWYNLGSGTNPSTSLTVQNNALVKATSSIFTSNNLSKPDTTAGSESGGIVFDGTKGTVYGNVTLQDDLEIKSGESLTVGKDASLTVPENVKLTNNGTVTTEEGGTLTGVVTGTVIYKVTDVSLDKTELTLTEGGSETLTAIITPSNATDQTVKWSSEDTDVISVAVDQTDNTKATVKALKEGSATITATTADGNKTATCTVTVTAKTYSISATPNTLNFGSITEGEERPAAQTVTVKNTGNQTVTLNQPTATNFEITTSDNLTLAPGETATFTVQPKDKLPRGSYSEQITITGDNNVSETLTASFTVKEPPYSGKYSYEVFTSVGDNGTVTVDRYATEGDKVTIDVTPDQAYKLDDLSVTAGGKDVELVDNGDGTYTFTMPSADVKITATFAEDPDWTEPEEPATDVSDLFIDIAPDAWYKDAVQYAYDNGLMTGVSATEFDPEATTTRAMIVSILARLENVTTAEAAGFADVDDEWYATAVNWAANVGVVNGYEDNTFKPNTAITREQLAAILMNYAAYKGEDVSNRADLTSYTDQPSTWAEEAMSWAVAEGLISGVTADTLQPQGAATRAQVAAILQRFLSE